MIDWTWTYFEWIKLVAYRPGEVVRGQIAGGCWAATICYMMEFWAMWHGYPPRRLSQRYSAWTDGTHDDKGVREYAVFGAAKSFGICREEFMPTPIFVGETSAFSGPMKDALTTPPSPEAVADALNQTVTDWAAFPYNGLADLELKAQAAIAAGYPLAILTPEKNHVMCAMGCDDDGLICLDSRSNTQPSQASFSPAHLSWNLIGGVEGVLRGVRFAGAKMGQPPRMLGRGGVVISPLKGNGAMLDDIIRIAQAGKAKNDKVTAAERDALIAASTALVPDAVTPGQPPGDVVWVDDAVPAGATLASDGGDGWTWIASNPAPYSGSVAHQSNLAAGEHQHYFQNVKAPLSVAVGDTLFAYVYLDPANPPSEVMLQWNDGTWEHRAYWGANLIGWGADDSVSRRFMGALPATGQWVRLSVPAAQVGLEGRTLNGMAFTLYGGRATWDYAGKS